MLHLKAYFISGVVYSFLGRPFPSAIIRPSRQRTLFHERGLVQTRTFCHGLFCDEVNPLQGGGGACYSEFLRFLS